MRLVQFLTEANERRVALVSADGTKLQLLNNTPSVRELALDAHFLNKPLADLVLERTTGGEVDYAPVIAENRLLLPLDHPDPAHCYVSGTGLDHA